MSRSRASTFQFLLTLALTFLIAFGIGVEEAVTKPLAQRWTITNMTPPADIYLLDMGFGNFEFQIHVHHEFCPERTVLIDDKHAIANSSFDAFQILKTVGPDEFLIQLEGKVLLLFNPIYIECGKYIQTFPLKHEGVYHLSLVRLRANYSAAADTYYSPPIHYEEIITEWIVFNHSKPINRHVRNSTYGENAGVWLLKESSFLALNHVFDSLSTFHSFYNYAPYYFNHSDQLNLPVYIPLESNELSCVKKVLNHYHWSHDGFNQTVIPSEEFLEKLQAINILFVGDSQMRSLTNHLIWTLCSIEERISFGKNPNYRDLLKSHPQCKHLKIDLHRNLLFEPIALPTGQHRPDIIVLNWGHHPASHAHYSYLQYAEAILHQLLQLFHAGYHWNQIIWIESVPFPIQQREDIFRFRDRRTIHRIRIMNQIAKEIMVERKIKYISTWQRLLPFVNRVCDEAHYLVKHLYDPIIYDLLRNIPSK